MGNSHVKRYIGGKKPQKYFHEDVWPDLKHMFEKLGLDEGKGFELFIAFSKIDADQSGKVSVKESMSFFGGKRSKYTERMFDVLDIGERDGLAFPEFVCALWNFCTMYTVLLARHMFEIFDPDMTGVLEAPDIEALYRMIYDSDYHEPKLTEAFPYDESGKITRENFILHIRNNRQFIKPATSFQSKVRKALGGFIMWETLTSFRKRRFAEIDETSDSLDEAVERILNSEFVQRQKELLDLDEKDRMEREEILRRAQEMQEEKRILEEEQEVERRRRQNQLDDENVKLAWMSYEATLAEFEAEVFSLNDTWRRKEWRDALYSSFDNAHDVTERYWAHKYSQEFKLVSPDGGMPLAEKELRLKDLMATPEGPKELERVETLTLLDLVRARIIKKLSAEDPMIKSIDGITSNLQQSTDTVESAALFAKQLAKWGETKKAKNGLHDKMLDLVMNNAIDAVIRRQQEETEERKKQYKRKEFEITTKYGARETRWETVYDARKRLHITINVDTMQILEPKFCICEQCDSTIDPADFKCYTCGAMRSVRNSKFYKALGT